MSVQCGMSAVSSGYYGFLQQLNWPPRYSWTTDLGSYKFTIRTKRKRTKNANETNEKQTNASHERYEKPTIHETNARYMNERTKWYERTIRKTQTNERTIHEENERYTKRTHDTRTNESLERNHILSNDKRS